jgi:hypothetical protein
MYKADGGPPSFCCRKHLVQGLCSSEYILLLRANIATYIPQGSWETCCPHMQDWEEADEQVAGRYPDGHAGRSTNIKIASFFLLLSPTYVLC